MNAVAKFAMTPNRRSLIGKVHVAKKELCLVDDDYRGVLMRVTGKASAADCSDSELVTVIDEFKNKGWQAQPKNPASARTASRRADHPSARKARALWISLGHLGAIANPSEKALEAFAKRQLRCDRLQWADQSQMYALIEALKSIGNREGWNSVGPLAKVKIRLIEAIFAKLNTKEFVAENWTLEEAIGRITGMQHPQNHPLLVWSMSDLDLVAAAFGRLLKTGRKDAL